MHTATTHIYTLSLHDALPIFPLGQPDIRRRKYLWSGCRQGILSSYLFRRHMEANPQIDRKPRTSIRLPGPLVGDRKSTRLNSSHLGISYAVFCLKKKNKINT